MVKERFGWLYRGHFLRRCPLTLTFCWRPGTLRRYPHTLTFGILLNIIIIYKKVSVAASEPEIQIVDKPGQYWKSETAEVMVWDRNGEIITADIARCEGITANYQNVDQVMAILNRARAYRR